MGDDPTHMPGGGDMLPPSADPPRHAPAGVGRGGTRRVRILNLAWAMDGIGELDTPDLDAVRDILGNQYLTPGQIIQALHRLAYGTGDAR